MSNSLKSQFKNLPINRKIALFGSVLTILAVFLPWYSDVDRFNISVTFLGITGPLYLTGYIILGLSLISFGTIIGKMIGRPWRSIPLRDGDLYITVGIANLLMMAIASSVYFHAKFGVNLTGKSMGIGMLVSIVGSSVLIAAGLLVKKGKVETFTRAEKQVPDFDHAFDDDPLADMNFDNMTDRRGDLGLHHTKTVGEAMREYQDEFEDSHASEVVVKETSNTKDIS